MSFNSEAKLKECLITTNCVLVEWKFKDLQIQFNNLVEIASQLPRTVVLEESNSYWHGVCRSFIFRFPDDLQILKLPREGTIQVRSASRLGASDLGVNRNRVNYLYRKLIKKQ